MRRGKKPTRKQKIRLGQVGREYPLHHHKE